MKLPLQIISNLQKTNIKFLVVGGVAVVLYGVPRATFNLDIMVPVNEKDLVNLFKSLKKLGYTEIHDQEKSERGEKSIICSIDEFNTKLFVKNEILRLKNGYNIDIVVTPDNEFFDFIYNHRIEIIFNKVLIPIPSLVDLIRIKELRGTEKDMEDARKLRFQLMTIKRKKK